MPQLAAIRPTISRAREFTVIFAESTNLPLSLKRSADGHFVTTAAIGDDDELRRHRSPQIESTDGESMAAMPARGNAAAAIVFEIRLSRTLMDGDALAS